MPPAAFLHSENAPKSLRLGLRFRPDPLAGLRGPTSKGRGGEWRERRGSEGKGGTLDFHNVGDRLTPLHLSTVELQLLNYYLDKLHSELFSLR